MATQNENRQYTAELNLEVKDAQVKMLNSRFEKMVGEFTRIVETDLGMKGFDYLNSTMQQFEGVMKKVAQVMKETENAQKQLKKQMQASGHSDIEIAQNPQYRAYNDKKRRLDSLTYLRNRIADIPDDAALNKKYTQLDKWNQKLAKLVKDVTGVDGFDFITASLKDYEKVQSVMQKTAEAAQTIREQLEGNSDSKQVKQLEGMLKKCQQILPMMEKMHTLQGKIDKVNPHVSYDVTKVSGGGADAAEYKAAIAETKERNRRNASAYKQQMKSLPKEIADLPNVSRGEKDYKVIKRQFTMLARKALGEKYREQYKDTIKDEDKLKSATSNAASKAIEDFNKWIAKKETSEGKASVAHMKEYLQSLLNDLPRDQKFIDTTPVDTGRGDSKLKMIPVGTVGLDSGDIIKSYRKHAEFITEVSKAGKEVERAVEQFDAQSTVTVSGLDSLKAMKQFLRHTDGNKKGQPMDYNGRSLFRINQGLEQIRAEEEGKSAEEVAKREQVIANVLTDIGDLAKIASDKISEYTSNMDNLTDTQKHELEVYNKFVNQISSEYNDGKLLYQAARKASNISNQMPSDFEYFGGDDSLSPNDQATGFGQLNTMGTVEREIKQYQDEIKEQVAQFKTSLTGKDAVEYGQRVGELLEFLATDSFAEGLKDALSKGTASEYIGTIRSSILATIDENFDSNGKEIAAGLGFGEGAYGHGVYKNKSGRTLISQEDLNNPENIQKIYDDVATEDKAIQEEIKDLTYSQRAIILLNEALDKLAKVSTESADTLEHIKDRNNAIARKMAGVAESDKAPKDIGQAINMTANGLSNYITQGKVIVDANKEYAKASSMSLDRAIMQNLPMYSDEMQQKIIDSIKLRKGLDEVFERAIEAFRQETVNINGFDNEADNLLQQAQVFPEPELIRNLSLFYQKADELVNSPDFQKLGDNAPQQQFVNAVNNLKNTFIEGFISNISNIGDKHLNGFLDNIRYFKEDYKAFAEFMSKFYGETYDIGGKSFNHYTPEEHNKTLPKYAGTPDAGMRAPKERYFDRKGYSILATYGVNSFEEALPLAYSRLEEKDNLLGDELQGQKKQAYDIVSKYNKDLAKAGATIAAIEEKYSEYLETTKTGTKIQWKEIHHPDKDFFLGTKLSADAMDKDSDEYKQVQEELTSFKATKEEIERDKKAYKAAKASITKINKSAKYQDALDTLGELSQDNESLVLESTHIEGQIAYMEQILDIKQKQAQEEQAKLEAEQKETAAIQKEQQVVEATSQRVIQAKQDEANAQPDYDSILDYMDNKNEAVASTTATTEATKVLDTALEEHQLDMQAATDAEKEKLKVSAELTAQLKEEYNAIEMLNKAFGEHPEMVRKASTSERRAKQQAQMDEGELPFALGEDYDKSSHEANRKVQEYQHKEAVDAARRPDYYNVLDANNAEQVIQELTQNPSGQNNVVFEKEALAQYLQKLREQVDLLEKISKLTTLIDAAEKRRNELANLNNTSAKEELRTLTQQRVLLKKQRSDLNELYQANIDSKYFTGVQEAIQEGHFTAEGTARKMQMDQNAVRNAEEAILSGKLAGEQKVKEQSFKNQNSLVDSYLKNYQKLINLTVTQLDLVEKSKTLEGEALTQNEAQLEKVREQKRIEQEKLEVLNLQAKTLNGMALNGDSLMRLREGAESINAGMRADITANRAKVNSKDRESQEKNQNKQAEAEINRLLNVTKRRDKIEQQIARTQKTMQNQFGEQLQNSQALVKNLEVQKLNLDNTIAAYDREKGILNGIQLTEEQRVALNGKLEDSQLEQQYNLSRIEGLQTRQLSFIDKVLSGFKQQVTYLIDMSLAYQAVGKVRQILGEIVDQTIKLDESIVDIQIATGMTRQETQALLQTYVQMGDKLGRNANEIATAANDWLRAGYEGEKAAKLTEASMMLSTLGMIESGDATTYLISTLKGWKLQAEDVIGVVDKLTVIKCSVCLVISIGHKSKCR